jgi:hypothetical protein
VAVGACLQIQYTGAQASCLLIGDAAAKTLTSSIGAVGAEAVDAAFGVAGVLDLTGATVDTLLELKAVIDAYADYTAAILYGDDIPTQYVVSATWQAKGTPGYVLFTLASVLSSYALTTWARAKLFLALQDSDQTMAEYLINGATEIAEDLARRKLKARVLTQDLDGSGREKLIVPTYPINSVTSLYQDSARAFGVSTLLTEGTDFLVYSDEGFLVNLYGVWPEGRKTIRLTWPGGLTTVDERLQDAAIECVSWNLKRFRGSSIGVRSISAPDGLNTAMELEIPLNARRVFESYRDGRR